jgi:monosaccharide-transporting ATPase
VKLIQGVVVMSEPVPILEAKRISKNFPGVKALSEVDFRLFKGEIHAIMGQNGAGKSTLIKILTGVYQHDSGEIILEGKRIRLDSPIAAQRLGISTVYQEINLCPNLSIAENIFIGREPRRLGAIDIGEMNRWSRYILEKLNISVDVTSMLSSVPIAIQQMAAIARVLDTSAKILILDEPTSSLDEGEVEQLFSVLGRLRDEGLAIVFITHFLDQTYKISDRITVLKNGMRNGEFMAADLPKLELIARMLGKELSEFSYTQKSVMDRESGTMRKNGGEKVLSARGLGLCGSMEPFDIDVGQSEVLGLAGLLGSGRTEMARLIFGIDSAEKGSVFVKGKKYASHSPMNAIKAGIGFCPEDRKSEGIFSELTVRDNIIIALQGRMGVFRNLSQKKQTEIADEFIKMLDIQTPGANATAGQLSGGNQQKMLLARWLATLILDEPTRGIDVGAKLEIMELILSLAKAGMGVIFISSEFEELVRCSNRIAVLRDNAKICELEGEELNESHILAEIAGGKKE